MGAAAVDATDVLVMYVGVLLVVYYLNDFLVQPKAIPIQTDCGAGVLLCRRRFRMGTVYLVN